MNINDNTIQLPTYYNQIIKESEALGFNMLSDLQTGAFLRTLAASKPRGNFLEIGTGTGLSLTWLAEGADGNSTIVSLDNSESCQQIARKVFDKDKRISIECEDGGKWLEGNKERRFDLIFADAWPGKFEKLDVTLDMVRVGGFYLIDDLLPQANWPDGHQEKVDRLIENLNQRQDFILTTFNWSTGLMLLTKIRE